jgi:hypothetical protein
MKKLMLLLQIFILLTFTACGGGGGGGSEEDPPELVEFKIDNRTDFTAESGGREPLDISIAGEEDYTYSILAQNGEIKLIDEQYYYIAPDAIGTDKISVMINYGVNKVVNNVMDIAIIENEPEWTYMLYMGADSNLNGGVSQTIYDKSYDFANKDLEEIESALYNNEVNVVVFVDYLNTNNGEAGLYNLTKEGLVKIEDILEPNTGQKENLSYLIDYSLEYFPANRYILGIWGHGDGWRLEEQSKRVIAPDYTSDNDGLNLYELEEGILDSQLNKIDIIAFDACLMGGIETAYQLGNLCEYIVSSPELTPTNGFEYERIFTYIMENYSIDSEEIAKKIVDINMQSYAVGGSQYMEGTTEAVVYSVAKQSKLENLVNELDKVMILLDQNEGILEEVEALRYQPGALEESYVLEYDKNYMYSDRSFYVDFGDLFKKMRNIENIEVNLSLAIDELLTAYNEYIIYAKYQNGLYYGEIEAFEENSTGLSMFMDFNEKYTEYYNEYNNASKFGEKYSW